MLVQEDIKQSEYPTANLDELVNNLSCCTAERIIGGVKTLNLLLLEFTEIGMVEKSS